MILEKEIKALIKKGLYKNKESIYNEALNFFFVHRPDLRITSAIELYINNEVSLMKATEVAGLDIESFKNELKRKGHSIILENKKDASFKKGLNALKNNDNF